MKDGLDAGSTPFVSRLRVMRRLRTVRRAHGSGIKTGATRILLVAPAVGLMIVFFGWPVLDVFLRSLDPEGLVSYTSPRLSLDNYIAIVQTPVLRALLLNTFEISAITAVVCAVLAFPTAYLMSRLQRRAVMVLLMLILASFFVSVVARLFAFTIILGRNGLINTLLETLGFGGPYDLLFNTGSTVVGMVNYLLPFMIIILYSAMSDIDTSLMTAASTLGASGPQAFRKVYFPLVRPALVGGMLLVFVLALGFFLTPAVLGGPQNITIPVYMKDQIGALEWGTASSTGIVLLVITVLGYAFALRSGASSVLPARQGSGSRGSVEREPLRFSVVSGLLWVATGISLIILLAPLIIVVPASFDSAVYLGFPPEGFTFRWYIELFNSPIWGSALIKSGVVGFGTAVLATSFGLILSRLMMYVRSKSVRTIAQAVIFAPLAVPVIVLAIGIYDVEVQLGLIETFSGLMLAHAVIALPLAFVVLSNALSNLDPALESAAWTMGASRTYAFWRIVIPNIIPSLIGAFLLCFVISWDEVVIALFQTGLQKTLPVTIFSEVITGASPAVAAVASILVGVVLLGLVTWGIVTKRTARSKLYTRPALSGAI